MTINLHFVRFYLSQRLENICHCPDGMEILRALIYFL